MNRLVDYPIIDVIFLGSSKNLKVKLGNNS